MQNFYQPKNVKILKVIQESPDTKTFVLECGDAFCPGQFFMAGLSGIGEAPISISGDSGGINLTIKRMGCLTKKFHALSAGDTLQIRGPFGNGFDLKGLAGKDLLVVAGGVGLAPLRPLIRSVLKERDKYKRFIVIYGARTPDDVLFKEELCRWQGNPDMQLLLTVDCPDISWKHCKGVVTEFLHELKLDPLSTAVVTCGPGIMMKHTVNMLLDLKLDASRIIVSLERHMKCGIGKCGHCYAGEKFVCLDGPVFTYSELLKLKPEVEL